MYEPIRPVKNMTSEQRKTHIPILSWGIPVEVRSSSACGSKVIAAACVFHARSDQFACSHGLGSTCSAIPTETRMQPRIKVDAKRIPSVLRSNFRCMK